MLTHLCLSLISAIRKVSAQLLCLCKNPSIICLVGKLFILISFRKYYSENLPDLRTAACTLFAGNAQVSVWINPVKVINGDKTTDCKIGTATLINVHGRTFGLGEVNVVTNHLFGIAIDVGIEISRS